MRCLLFIAASLFAPAPCHAGDPNGAQTRWLQAGAAVIDYAKQQRMPLDVTFQRHAKAGDAPLSIAFDGRRCQLVFAVRDNPDADTTLAQLDPELLTPVVEAMVAHELGHCWRFVRGAWHTVPAGFARSRDKDRDRELERLNRSMRETRREEGFADLVGLAWTHARHPALYDAVHGWFSRTRGDPPVAGAHHDTGAWLELAKDPRMFLTSGNPFEAAWPLWMEGLRKGN